MNRNIQRQIDKLIPIWNATDEVLNDWKGEGCLQFPTLVSMLAVKLNWDDEQMRKNDPFVRSYVRDHDDWHVTRGAHGGIMRRSEKDRKDAEAAQKKAAKEQVAAAAKAKAAQKLAEAAAALATSSSPSVATDDNDTASDEVDDNTSV